MNRNLRNHAMSLALAAALVALAAPAAAAPREAPPRDGQITTPAGFAGWMTRMGEWLDEISITRILGTGSHTMDPNGQPSMETSPAPGPSDTGEDGGDTNDPNA